MNTTDKKELEIALTTYIALNKNQAECTGFIEGFETAIKYLINEKIITREKPFLNISIGYRKQYEQCSRWTFNKKNELKKGDTVKYTDDARSQLGSSADNRKHIVSEVKKRSDMSDYIHLNGGDCCDAEWLEIVKSKK
tara:strand:+ start:343 stop:756 length:414 start_codon:yes stop_codon:yes gene_type:complete